MAGLETGIVEGYYGREQKRGESYSNAFPRKSAGAAAAGAGGGGGGGRGALT